MNIINIRPALMNDAKLLAALATQVWLDTYAKDGIRADMADYVATQLNAETFVTLLQDPSRSIWLAERDSFAVGFAQINHASQYESPQEPEVPLPPPEGGETTWDGPAFVSRESPQESDMLQARNPAELERLYVQEPSTGLGLGRRLLNQAEHAALQRGASHLWLCVWAYNERALAFYAACDYVHHGKTYFELGQERHANDVLAKKLSS